MNSVTQLPSEYLKHTATSGSQFSNPIPQGNTNTNTATSSAGVFLVISNVVKRQNQSKDIDDFIGELLAKDKTLEMEFQNARKSVADVIYEGQPESLKTLRLRAGFSQVQLAEKIGMQQPNICEFETGKRRPNAETLLRLSAALNVTADVLLKAITGSEQG